MSIIFYLEIKQHHITLAGEEALKMSWCNYFLTKLQAFSLVKNIQG